MPVKKHRVVSFRPQVPWYDRDLRECKLTCPCLTRFTPYGGLCASKGKRMEECPYHARCFTVNEDVCCCQEDVTELRALAKWRRFRGRPASAQSAPRRARAARRRAHGISRPLTTCVLVVMLVVMISTLVLVIQ